MPKKPKIIVSKRPPKGAIPTIMHANSKLQKDSLGPWGRIEDLVKFLQKHPQLRHFFR